MKLAEFNRAQIDECFFDCETLKDVFLKIEKDLEQDGMVVCQYSVNKIDFDEQNELENGSMPQEKINHLSVKFEQPLELLKNVLHNWLEDIPQLIIQADSLVSETRQKGLEGRFSLLVQFIDRCQALVDGLISLRNIIQMSNFNLEDRWLSIEKSFAQAIGEALNALEKKDFNLLSDVVEYDDAESLNQWHKVVIDLIVAIEKDLEKSDDVTGDDLRRKLFRKSISESSSEPNSLG